MRRTCNLPQAIASIQMKSNQVVHSWCHQQSSKLHHSLPKRHRWKSFDRLWWTHHVPACGEGYPFDGLSWKVFTFAAWFATRALSSSSASILTCMARQIHGGLHMPHHLLELVEHPQYHWLSCWSYRRSVVQTKVAHSALFPHTVGVAPRHSNMTIEARPLFWWCPWDSQICLHLTTWIQWSSSLLGWSSLLFWMVAMMSSSCCIEIWAIGTGAMANQRRTINRIGVGDAITGTHESWSCCSYCRGDAPVERDASNNRKMFLRDFSNWCESQLCSRTASPTVKSKQNGNGWNSSTCKSDWREEVAAEDTTKCTLPCISTVSTCDMMHNVKHIHSAPSGFSAAVWFLDFPLSCSE